MTKTNFLTQLAGILVTDPKSLQLDAPLKGFKGWDSMGQMSVLTLIDTDVGVPVPLDWMDQCKTVGDILSLVETKLES